MKVTQLCASTTPYHPWPIERALDGIARAGLLRVELSAIVGFCDHAAPEHLGPRGAKRLLSLLDSYGLTAVSMSGHADLASDSGVSAFSARLHLASEMGIAIISTGSTEVGKDVPPPDLEDRFFRNITQLADAAARLGVMIAIETHGALAGSGKEAVAVVERIGHPNVRINYDPSNVIYYRGIRPEGDLAAVGPYLVHFHIKDKASMKPETWDFPAIGEGILDWDQLFGDLDRMGFGGPASMEIELDGHPQTPEIVDEALARSFQFVNKYFKER